MNNNSTLVDNDLTALAEINNSAPVPLNPEDLTAFAISSDFDNSVAKKVLITVPVRKPEKESFIRTHPDINYWQKFGILELKEARKVYLVAPAVAAVLREQRETMVTTAILVLCVDRRGNPFLWPLKVSERECNWHSSAREAAEIGKTQWIRVVSNMSAGCNDIMVADSQTLQPTWPSESYNEILSLAFKGRVIKSYDDPVLQELRGA